MPGALIERKKGEIDLGDGDWAGYVEEGDIVEQRQEYIRTG